MATLGEEAQAYEPSTTKNITELPEVSIDIQLEDDSFETTDEDGKEKTVRQKVITLNGEKYRVPVSVLKQLKAQKEANPKLQKFKVSKSGEGMKTTYTVIPLV